MLPAPSTGTPRGVLIRDFLIFQLKLVLDGIKDAVLLPISTVVVLLELLFAGKQRGRTFYALMRAGESFDRWLNLHGALRRAAAHRDGLFAGSEPGDGTLLGEIEGLARGREARLEALRRGTP
jgi:hypothetical protein